MPRPDRLPLVGPAASSSVPALSKVPGMTAPGPTISRSLALARLRSVALSVPVTASVPASIARLPPSASVPAMASVAAGLSSLPEFAVKFSPAATVTVYAPLPPIVNRPPATEVGSPFDQSAPVDQSAVAPLQFVACTANPVLVGSNTLPSPLSPPATVVPNKSPAASTVRPFMPRFVPGKCGQDDRSRSIGAVVVDDLEH